MSHFVVAASGRSHVAALVLVALAALIGAPAAHGAGRGDRSERPLERVSSDPVELTSLRTERSRTYRTPEGARTVKVFAEPVHFRNADGRWQAIDNALSRTRSGISNGAAGYDLALPRSLARAVRVEEGSSSLAFRLLGASGGARVAGNTARYDDVLRGVDATYDAKATAVKETLTLSGPGSASSFRFLLAPGKGVTPFLRDDGRVDFVGSDSKVAFTFAPPFVQDASGDEHGFSTDAVHTSLRRSGRRYVLTVSIDRAWLDAPERDFPVQLDPTLDFNGADRDCYIVSGTSANTNFCGYATLNVGSNGTSVNRALLYFDLAAYVPKQSEVIDAELGLYLGAATTTNATTVTVHRLTHAWTGGIYGATWNKFDGTSAWTAPGGDFDPAAAATTTGLSSSTPGWKMWNPTQLVQSWLDGKTPNHGFLLKAGTEAVNNVLKFDSNYTKYKSPPYIAVTYQPRAGDLPRYTLDQHPLLDGLNAQVNVANGNLMLDQEDVVFDDTDYDYGIGHVYNNLSIDTPTVGGGWQLGGPTDVGLEVFPDGGVGLYGPTGWAKGFVRKTDGTFTSPPGLDATLVKETNGTYTLTWTETNDKWKFTSDGRLTSISDDAEGSISYTYDAYGQLTGMTDSEGRKVTPTYDAWGFLRTLDEPGGQHLYDQDSHGSLRVYTAPNGDRTTFNYDLNYNLVQVLYPGGEIRFAYDASNRVTSVTRVLSTGNQTTTYVYGTGTTTVTEPTGRKTIYTYDADLLVTKYEAGLTPPSLTLTGTLVGNANKTLTDGSAYGLHVAGSEATGVSLEITVDGDEVESASQGCSAACGAYAYDWTFDTEEYAPGEYVIGATLTDGQGDERSSSFKVTVPPKAPDTEPTYTPPTRDERLGDATSFRQNFGLNAETTYVNATLDDPTLADSEELYGVPLTSAELTELDTRIAMADEVGTIEDYALDYASEYADLYTDQAGGGLIYVGWTRNADQHMADLRARFPYPERLRSFTAARTKDDVATLHQRVTADVDVLRADGIDVQSVATSVEGNVVEVGVPSPTADQQSKLNARYGAGVTLVARSASQGAGREAAVRPLIAGLRIWKPSAQAGFIDTCTSNVNVYGDRSTGRTNRRRRYWTLTAGHCGTTGQTWSQSADGARKRNIGKMTTNYLQAAEARNGTTLADAALISTRANGRRPALIDFRSARSPRAKPRRVVATGAEATVSLNRPATASSSSTDRGPKNANDADFDTSWRSATLTPTTQTQSWRVDLQATRKLDRVTLRWDANEYARDYVVETSTDDSTYTTRATVTGATRGGSRTHRFAAVNARYVRITMTVPASGQNAYTLVEAEVVAAKSRRTRGDHVGDIVCQSGQTSNRVICGTLRRRDVMTFLTGHESAKLLEMKEWSRRDRRIVIRGGDSGGPVFVPRNRRRTRLTIIGINSYGYDDPNPSDNVHEYRTTGFSHIALALRLSKTKVCTPRTCRRR